jgi:FkbM family methyltransferase
MDLDATATVWAAIDPGAYLDMNPSVVSLRANDARAVFCRYPVPPEPGRGSIWTIRVDPKLQPVGAAKLLIGEGIDPRVVRLGDQVLIFYAALERDAHGALSGSSVTLASFRVDGDEWTATGLYRLPKRPIAGAQSPDSDPNWEKNWVPFVIDEETVGLIYSHEPWDVITLRFAAGATPKLVDVHRGEGLRWEYGTIRGGTPPVRYDEGHLVTFFHASQHMGSRNIYSVGACVFQDHAPFSPVLQTPTPLFVAPYRRGAERFGWRFSGSVVFPGGAVAARKAFTLLCGRDDGEIAAVAVDRRALAARLEPPRPAISGTVHDYSGRPGARLPLQRLLYVPDPIPGIPEIAMINFIRTLAGRGRTFLDIGSHIGFYTMGLAPGFERVIAFEPSRFQYQWLTRNRVLNDYAHVACEHVALGETPGSAKLHVLSYEGGLNTLSVEVAAAGSIIDTYTVPVERLDDRGLTDVDLMKIDVEGFEIPVLRGAARTIAASRPVILLEVWTDPERRAAVEAVMTGMDYAFEPMFPLSPELVLCLPRERRDAYRWFV